MEGLCDICIQLEWRVRTRILSDMDGIRYALTGTSLDSTSCHNYKCLRSIRLLGFLRWRRSYRIQTCWISLNPVEPQPQVVQPITTLTRSSQLSILEPPRPAVGTKARDWLTLRGVVSEMSCRTQESSKVKMALVLMISQFSFAGRANVLDYRVRRWSSSNSSNQQSTSTSWKRCSPHTQTVSTALPFMRMYSRARPIARAQILCII